MWAGGESDHVSSGTFRSMTKQEVTSLGDCCCHVFAHYNDNPSWQSDPPGPRPPSLSALIQDQGFTAGAGRLSNLCSPLFY